MYTTEIPYISNYYGDLTPVHLSFIAAINGFQPPDISQPFAYCELGCGCGKTTNTIAAAYPNSLCVGIDINGDHIEIAKKDIAGLSNIEFWNLSFGEALKKKLPKFDFITMHGVWSWVDDDVRSDIVNFVKKFLKPGGLFYISYDTMPGWSQLLPFHRIMSIYTKNKKCSVKEKAESAMAYLQFLNVNKSSFFERNPDAKLFLEILEKSDIRYIVHELFNDNLRPEYFADVASEMQKAGLDFVGDCVSLNNYHSVVPEPFKALLNTADNRVLLETHKSIIQNDRFRKDVYTKKSKLHKGKKGILSCLDNFKFGTMMSLSALALEVKVQGYTLTLSADPYLKIFKILSSGQFTIREINKKLKRSEKQLTETMDNVINCMLSGQFVVFLGEKCQIKEIEGFDFNSNYNRSQVLNWKEQYAQHIFLASAVTGGAIAMTKLQALLLSGMYQFGLLHDAVVNYVHEIVCDDMKNGNNIFGFSVEQNIRENVSAEYNSVTTFLMNTLMTHGIIREKACR